MRPSHCNEREKTLTSLGVCSVVYLYIASWFLISVSAKGQLSNTFVHSQRIVDVVITSISSVKAIFIPLKVWVSYSDAPLCETSCD